MITVANAYDLLISEGYVRSEEKRGYFVQDLGSICINGGEPAAFKDELTEHKYLADFRANRMSLHMFPSTVWNRYMREALSLQADSLLETVPYKGLYKLRLAISEYLLQNRGIQVSPSQIIIGAGTEYLYSRLIQLFGRTCTFASEDPGYKKFEAISRGYGNPWEYIPIDDHGLIIDKLEQSDADVIHVSPSNHFPTGIIMPITRRKALLDWANKVKKRYIIEDDYDSEFRYSGQLILPMYAMDSNNKVIYMNTFSKTLVPSIRISYMVLPPALMERYEETMSFYSCTVSSFEQYALAKFISEKHFERHINHMRNYYKKQRKRILSSLKKVPLSEISDVYERGAGTHFLLKVHTRLTEEEIRRVAHEANLAVSLYSDYSDLVNAENQNTLVINYAAIQPERITEVLMRMSEIFPECRE